MLYKVLLLIFINPKYEWNTRTPLSKHVIQEKFKKFPFAKIWITDLETETSLLYASFCFLYTTNSIIIVAQSAKLLSKGINYKSITGRFAYLNIHRKFMKNSRYILFSKFMLYDFKKNNLNKNRVNLYEFI